MNMRMKKTLVVILAFFALIVGVSASAESGDTKHILLSTLTEVPVYQGNDYVVINDNQPDFYIWQIQSTSYVVFSELDALGRTGAGMACLGPETLPTVTRDEIGDIRPSGWQTTRYDDLIEERYLYNRSHVIGYMLCGDNNSPENLFTGTRYLNASSMLQFELQVENYIETTKNHVIYRCTPVYEGDNLVASGVQMEAYSVEDRGTMRFNVFVFNIQPGIIIDYSTGASRQETEGSADRTRGYEENAKSEIPVDETPKPEPTFILNTNSRKFHKVDCSSVRDMKEKNKQLFYGTREEAIEKGYSPCGRCHP